MSQRQANRSASNLIRYESRPHAGPDPEGPVAQPRESHLCGFKLVSIVCKETGSTLNSGLFSAGVDSSDAANELIADLRASGLAQPARNSR